LNINLFKLYFIDLDMSLRDLLDAEVIGFVLLGIGSLHYIGSLSYEVFQTKLSFLKESFKDTQNWEKYIDKLLSEEKLPENNPKLLDAKQYVIKKYKSLLDKKVSKSLLFTRPLFYFQVKKEFDYIKEESEKRLNELQAA